MKIVDRAAFLAMPSGTIFQKFHLDRGLEDLQILESLAGPDFVSTELLSENMLGYSPVEIELRFSEMREDGASHHLSFDFAGRDGMFDHDQLFAVWSPDDVSALIAVLGGALARQTGATT